MWLEVRSTNKDAAVVVDHFYNAFARWKVRYNDKHICWTRFILALVVQQTDI